MSMRVFSPLLYLGGGIGIIQFLSFFATFTPENRWGRSIQLGLRGTGEMRKEKRWKELSWKSERERGEGVVKMDGRKGS